MLYAGIGYRNGYRMSACALREQETQHTLSVFCDVVLCRVTLCLCWRGVSVLMRGTGGGSPLGLLSVFNVDPGVAERDLFLKFNVQPESQTFFVNRPVRALSNCRWPQICRFIVCCPTKT